MRIKTSKKFRLTTVLAVLGILAGGSLFFLHKDNDSSAANAWSFDAGNIMSDYVMTSKNSMSEAQIQTFLNSKVTCDHWGAKTSELGEGTRAQYARNRGWSLPFQCLNTYTQDGETAARIIWQASQDYNINPQVLIVLLQKEQSLVTDEWPSPGQYRSATGYGCPDTAACDSQYYGFKNQVRNAAKFFNAYQTDNTAWYKLVWPGNKYTSTWQQFTYNIQWHPNTACGASATWISNRATASLYSYTPYRPNNAALNAGYGSAYGDGWIDSANAINDGDCSSYGNRNFYLYFTDWFGDPVTGFSYTQYNLADGDYVISSDVKDNKIITLNNSQNSIAITDYNVYSTNIPTVFNFQKQSDGSYIIQEKTTGQVLDVEVATFGDNGNVVLWNFHGGDNQKWELYKVNDYDGFIIAPKLNRLYTLDLPASNISNDTVLELYTLGQTKSQPNQTFYASTPISSPSTNISDGYYKISNVNDPGKVLDIQGSSRTNGAPVLLWPDNGNHALNQVFRIKKNSDNSYTILSANSNMPIDVNLAAATKYNNSAITQWQATDNDNQKWYVDQNSDGSYSFRAKFSTTHALDLPGGNTTNGTKLVLWRANGTKNQKFTLTKISSNLGSVNGGRYAISSAVDTNKLLDIDRGAIVSGSNVQTWQNNGGSLNQKWDLVFDPVDDDYYISTVNHGVNLNVSQAQATPGANVNIWSNDTHCGQKWQIERSAASSDSFFIQSRCSQMILDMAVATGNVTVWTKHGGNNQKWYFVKTD
jgi:hypothetical protein